MASVINHIPSQLTTSQHSPSLFLSPKPLFLHPVTTSLSKNYSPFILRSSSSSTSSSPFTEKLSSERYQRDSWVYSNEPTPNSSCSLDVDIDTIRDNDIALQLPELKRLLQTLRERRVNEGSGGGGDKRGPGNVFLVGTGPGDPELLTLKAVRAIESADLLLYDRLVSNDVLELVKADARLLYVGKTAGYHSRTQVGFS